MERSHGFMYDTSSEELERFGAAHTYIQFTEYILKRQVLKNATLQFESGVVNVHDAVIGKSSPNTQSRASRDSDHRSWLAMRSPRALEHRRPTRANTNRHDL